MTSRPRDLSDLYLAPVALAIDAQIEELGKLDGEALDARVALVSDAADFTSAQRSAALLETVRHLIDCHEWVLDWDPRGIRISHGEHSLVVGTPANFTSYVDG